MAIIRYYDPFQELEDMHRQLAQLMQQPFRQSTNQPTLTTPVADVYEEDGNLVVEAHLPNFDKKEIEIDIQDRALVIKATHSEKDEDKKKRQYVLRESASSFYRRVGLPRNVDADNIKADFHAGVLKVVVPMKELPKPKKINISGAKKSSKK